MGGTRNIVGNLVLVHQDLQEMERLHQSTPQTLLVTTTLLQLIIKQIEIHLLKQVYQTQVVQQDTMVL